MPFLGLLDERGREIERVAGYHRIDMSEIAFKVSPPREAEMHFTFVNCDMARWPTATSTWEPVYHLGIFLEVDDEVPIIVRPLGTSLPRIVERGCSLAMLPGQLTLSTRVSPPKEWWTPGHKPAPPDAPQGAKDQDRRFLQTMLGAIRKRVVGR